MVDKYSIQRIVNTFRNLFNRKNTFILKAEPWNNTSPDWATGFNILVDCGNTKTWKIKLEGISKETYLFQKADREMMCLVRDEIVKRINDR